MAIAYEAYLTDGTKFDSTDAERPLVFTPGLGDLIDGIEQGVIGVRTNGTRRLIIPPQLGFGAEPRRNDAGQVIIPANSTVIYDVTIVQVAQ